MEALSESSNDVRTPPSCWARGMSSFKGFVSLLLIIALSLLVALLLLKDNLNDQIRKTVEKKLGEVLANTNVSVTIDQAEFKRGKGIRLRGIRFVEDKKPLATFNDIYIRSKIELIDLLGDRMEMERIEIDGLRLYARQLENNKFNLEEIASRLVLPKKMKGKKPPQIQLRNCELVCSLIGRDESDSIELKVHDATLNPVKDGLAPFLHARISADFFRSLAVSVDFSNLQTWRVWGSAQKLMITKEVFDLLPLPLQKNAAVLEALKATVDFDFDVSDQPDGATVPEFFLVGKIREGSISDERLPFPISGLTAQFAADNSGVKFENVVAESLLGKMHLNFSTEGLSSDSPFELVANIDPLYLDQRLASQLPAEAQQFLNKFSPTGNIRLNSKLSYQGGRWIPDVEVDLLDVSFAFHKFPYPLSNATGKITLTDKKIDIRLNAFAAGRRVMLTGEFFEPGPNSYGELNIDLDGVIPIDATLMSAMEKMPDIARITKKFHPRGNFGFDGLYQRVKDRHGHIEEKFRHELSVEDVEFKYDLVPVAFDSVYGSFVVTENGTSLQGFRGKNVRSENFAQGSWDPVNGLALTIDSFDVELNESLKAAMPKQAVAFWNQLRPSGTLQSVRSNFWVRPGEQVRFEFEVRQSNESHELSLMPVWFPYELKNVAAHVSFRPNEFTVHRLLGHHRDSKLTVRGDGTYDQDGWECHFRKLDFDRLIADRELTSALPRSLGKTIEGLSLQGLINLSGSISFQGGRESQVRSVDGGPSPEVRTSWDLTADIDQGSLMCGVAIEDIYGAVRMTGSANGEYFESLGGMEIDSLVWNDVQFKKIRSPIYLDNNVALLGLWATAKRKNAKPESLTGFLFGGRLAANAQFSLHGNQPFQIQATLNEGDLQEFTFEVAPDYNDVIGRGFAGVRINGDNTGTHSLRGEGQIKLVDAKISEVPVMLSMLKLLSVNQVDRTLFNESHADFRIRGEHLFFDNLEFLGDAISIKGNGEMDFDQNIDLQFYTAVGRDGFRIPVISPLLGIASQQILVIDVNGSTRDPRVKKNFFKILNGKLQENFDDLEDSLESGGERFFQAAEIPFSSLKR